MIQKDDVQGVGNISVHFKTQTFLFRYTGSESIHGHTLHYRKMDAFLYIYIEMHLNKVGNKDTV